MAIIQQKKVNYRVYLRNQELNEQAMLHSPYSYPLGTEFYILGVLYVVWDVQPIFKRS